MKLSEICDHELCGRKFDKKAYTPITIEIYVKNKQRVKSEKYKGKFCTWRCAGDQQNLWFQRSKHV